MIPEIHCQVMDYDTSAAVYRRRFFKREPGYSFAELIAPASPWEPWETDSGEGSTVIYPVSFVFSDDGKYIHATTASYVDSSYRIYYGVLDVTDPESGWTNTFITSSTNRLVKTGDIILDPRGKPMIVYQRQVVAGGDYGVYLYYWAEEIPYTVLISGGTYNPQGPCSIVIDEANNYCLIDAADLDTPTVSHFYRVPFNDDGIPVVPPAGSWDNARVGSNGFGYSIMAVGDDGIGILCHDASNDWYFFLYTGLAMSAGEMLNQSYDCEFTVLTFRDGTWHAIGTAPNAPGYVYYIRNGANNWTPGPPIGELGDNAYSYFGIISQRHNPQDMGDKAWGFQATRTDDTTPWPVKFLYTTGDSNNIFDVHSKVDLPTGHFMQQKTAWFRPGILAGWTAEKLMAANCTHFEFDIDNNAAGLMKSGVIDNHSFMDIVAIEDDLVWTNQENFFYFTDEFKDFILESAYSMRSLVLETGSIDAGIPYLKKCREIIVDADVDESATFYIIVMNENGVMQQYQFYSSNPFTSSSQNYSKIPLKLNLLGRNFRVMIQEHSEKDSGLRSIKLRGVDTGNRR